MTDQAQQRARHEQSKATIPTKNSIFTPGLRHYTNKEIDFIMTLLPMDKLPKSLSLDSEYDLPPPIFVRGWMIPYVTFRRKAKDMGIEMYFSPENGKALFNRVGTFNIFVGRVLKSLGIILNVPCYTRNVISSRPNAEGHAQGHLMFGLYDNHTPDELKLTADELEKIRDAFGFSGKPRWYPETCGLRWGEYE